MGIESGQAPASIQLNGIEGKNSGRHGDLHRYVFRSSATLTLTAKSWNVETSFVDAEGKPLSDHQPVSVTFEAQ